MTNRKVLFDNLKSKMLAAGFQFEKEQKPHLQKRKESELVFTHPDLINKFYKIGIKVKAKKFYVKPLSDDPNCEIGLVTGNSSPIYDKECDFILPNAIDTFKDVPAWSNNKSNNSLDIILSQIKLYVYSSKQEYYIQYHNADKLGNYPLGRADFNTPIQQLVLDNKVKYDVQLHSKKKQIENAIGHYCFLIVGKKDRGVNKYYLWSHFRMDDFTKDQQGKYVVNGTGFDFQKPILLNKLVNFNDFLKFCGNFGIGFQRIDNHVFASTLISLIQKYQYSYNESTNIVNDNFEDQFRSFEFFKKIENEDVNSNKNIKALQKKYKDAKPEVITALVNRIERGEIANEIKNLYGHKCLLCESLELNPYSFHKKDGDKLKGSKKYYVETHHIVPVSLLKKGSLGIENMITLCPNHHRQFHFGDVEIQKNTSKKLELIIDGKTKVRIEKKIEHLL